MINGPEGRERDDEESSLSRLPDTGESQGHIMLFRPKIPMYVPKADFDSFMEWHRSVLKNARLKYPLAAHDMWERQFNIHAIDEPMGQVVDINDILQDQVRWKERLTSEPPEALFPPPMWRDLALQEDEVELYIKWCRIRVGDYSMYLEARLLQGEEVEDLRVIAENGPT